MNGIDPEIYCPQILPDPIATERIEAVVAALVGLAQAGAPIMPDDPAIDQIRSRLHLAKQPKLSPQALGVISRGAVGTPPSAPKPPDDGDGSDPEDAADAKGDSKDDAAPKDADMADEEREDSADQADAPKASSPKTKTVKKARTLFRTIDKSEEV